tara:strand:+ start:35 stop:424 length:390 start_codon:yes stop_codon:yes gene_type:complete
MDQDFNLEIISPEKILLKDKAKSVTIPSFEGEMTIMPDHIPLITFLRPGITRVFGSKETNYFVEEGTVEFSNNTLIILSSTIILLNSLTSEMITKMLDESKSRLSSDKLDDKTRYIISHKLDSLSKINQ